jgi:hypothetical protein
MGDAYTPKVPALQQLSMYPSNPNGASPSKQAPYMPYHRRGVPNFQILQSQIALFLGKTKFIPSNISFGPTTLFSIPQKLIKLLSDLPDNLFRKNKQAAPVHLNFRIELTTNFRIAP